MFQYGYRENYSVFLFFIYFSNQYFNDDYITKESLKLNEKRMS